MYNQKTVSFITEFPKSWFFECLIKYFMSNCDAEVVIIYKCHFKILLHSSSPDADHAIDRPSNNSVKSEQP